jgi:hypothetical protein
MPLCRTTKDENGRFSLEHGVGIALLAPGRQTPAG